MIRKAAIEHAVKPPRLLGKTFKPVTAILLVLQRTEMMHLPRHPHATTPLPTQPPSPLTGRAPGMAADHVEAVVRQAIDGSKQLTD